MPLYHPFTDAKTNGEATEGNRHVELRRQVRRKVENAKRKSKIDAGRGRRGHRGAEEKRLQLGGGYQRSTSWNLLGLGGNLRRFRSRSNARKIIFHFLEKALLTNSNFWNKLSSVKPTALRNIQTTPKTGTCLARLHIRQ